MITISSLSSLDAGFELSELYGIVEVRHSCIEHEFAILWLAILLAGEHHLIMIRSYSALLPLEFHGPR